MMNKLKIDKKKYVLRHRYYSKDKDFGITISNRAGNLINSEYKIPALKEPLKFKCNYPSYTFFIDYNGDVQMCSHDWGKKIVLGNLKNEKLIDIWFKEKSMKIRKTLLKSNRNFSPCNVCDVDGTLMGKINSIYFE